MNQQIRQRIQDIQAGIVPQGYKSTPCGVLPCEWELKKYKDVYEYIQPNNYIVSNTLYSDSYNVPVLTAGKTFILGHTNDEEGIFCDTPVTLFDDFTTAVQYVDFPFKVKSSAAKILKVKDGFNPVLAHCKLTSIQYVVEDHQRHWISKFSNFKTYFPCKAEQDKIAEVLMTWDRAVKLQQQYIEQLLQRKKVLMQTLLTPQPHWQKKKISEIMKSRDKRQLESNEAPLMSFVANKGICPKGDRYDRSFLIKNAKKSYKLTELNDFIYSSNNLDVGSIGLNEYGRAVISDVYEIFSINDENIPVVISELVKSKKTINNIISFRQGVIYGQYRIHANDFLKVEVETPSIQEQQHIADILTCADNEIEQNKVKLQHLQTQRKAMQQLLLTGIARLNV